METTLSFDGKSESTASPPSLVSPQRLGVYPARSFLILFLTLSLCVCVGGGR